MDESLRPFVRPQGVVVAGVSASLEKLGYGIARNLIGSGYAGAIHFVSQRGGQLFGKTVYERVELVPDPADLAVLAVPAGTMAETLSSCARRGIRAAILVSAGFREAGEAGAALEKECCEIARANGMRLLGPNCIGIIDTHLPLDTSFLQPPMPERGGVAFLSQSGAFCAAIIDWARGEGFGFSQIVSLGNQADVTETEMLAAMADDEHTRAIVLYLEGIGDGRRFVQVAGEITRRKPVVALKVGRFEAARKAAASHTGVMAGSDDAYDAAFRKAGVLRASSAEELFDWARALEACSLPSGRRVAVLTDAGGPGVIATDALEAGGLSLATLNEPTLAALQRNLPPAASIQNPVDMLASASPQDYAECLRLLLGDPAVDAALVILPPPPMFRAEEVAAAMIPIVTAASKPVVVCLMGSLLVDEARSVFHTAKIPVYAFPERAARSLSALATYSEHVLRSQNKDRAVGSPAFSRGPDSLTGMSAEQIAECYGIPTVSSRLARTAEEAGKIAEELGFPVVMKIASPDILHKSDVGGVLAGLASWSEVLNDYTQMLKEVQEKQPKARIEGVNIQRQVPAGQEIIVGAVQDASFGPLIMFGSGGVEAEGIRDMAFALAPLNEAEAAELMDRTWAGRKLDGFRNIGPADKKAALDVLMRLSWLAYEHPELKEIEINPLRVLESGAIALDVRHRL